MKKLLGFLILVSLAACQPWDEKYAPELKARPGNQAKYERDKSACIEEAKLRFRNAKPTDASPYFGLAGYLYDKAANSQDDDFHKSMPEMANECLITKGYKIQSR